MKVDLVIRGARVVTHAGEFHGGVAVDDGRIVAVGADDALPGGEREIDADGHATSSTLTGRNFLSPACSMLGPCGVVMLGSIGLSCANGAVTMLSALKAMSVAQLWARKGTRTFTTSANSRNALDRERIPQGCCRRDCRSTGRAS
jgi:hypothetical protein